MFYRVRPVYTTGKKEPENYTGNKNQYYGVIKRFFHFEICRNHSEVFWRCSKLSAKGITQTLMPLAFCSNMMLIN
jgi:hypothetical protein